MVVRLLLVELVPMVSIGCEHVVVVLCRACLLDRGL